MLLHVQQLQNRSIHPFTHFYSHTNSAPHLFFSQYIQTDHLVRIHGSSDAAFFSLDMFGV